MSTESQVLSVEKTEEEFVPRKVEYKTLSPEQQEDVYKKAFALYLKEECLADLKYMENILVNERYMINRRTGQPNNNYRYRLNLFGKNALQQVELDDGRITYVEKKRLLKDRKFIQRIIGHYKKIGTFVKVYQDRRKDTTWWMQFTLI